MRTRGEESRVQILATAKALFVQHGYANTSIRLIAEEAGGRTVANLYNYFNSKEAIFATLIREENNLSELAARLECLAERSTPLLAGQVLRIFLSYLQTDGDFVELLIIDMREHDRKHLNIVLEDIRRVLNVLTSQLDSMPDRRWFETSVMVRILVSAALGYMFTGKLNPDSYFEQSSDAVWVERFVDVCVGRANHMTSKSIPMAT